MNSLAPLPVAAGVSTAVFTATITPHPFGSTTTTTVPPALPPTTVSVGNAAILEGDVGTHTLKIPVTRSDTTNGNGTVHYAVTTNTAKSTDFTTVSGNLSFSGSTMQKTISVTVKGDKTSESNETMKVKLTSPSAGYVLGRENGVGTILNDDVHTKLTVGAGDIGVVVGDAGNQTLSFPITLSKAVTTKVTMHYVVSGISAVAGAGHDFCGTLSGTVSIAAGSRQGAVKSPCSRTQPGVANKTLKVTLSSLHAPTGSKFVRAVGKGTLFPSPVIFSIN